MTGSEFEHIIKQVKSFISLEKESGTDEVMLKDMLKHKPHGHTGPGSEHPGRQKLLDELKERASNCKDCALSGTRRSVVFGEGSPDAELMFIGEAPGFDEDVQGRPFVGKAGMLLTKIIESIGLTRKEVYIANCLKCRPPQNRDPLPSEIIACREFMMKQIEIIGPKVICCLGKFAAQTLLMSEAPITKLRGRFYDFEGIKLMPTFHPAYLLRNPDDKKLVWEDMKKIRDYLNNSD